MPNLKALHFVFWLFFIATIPMMALLIGFILAPLALGLGVWYSFYVYPRIKKVYDALEEIAETELSQIDSRVDQVNRLIQEIT